MEYQAAAESRDANITYHLVPASVWKQQCASVEYVPEELERDGFIHCTNGLNALLDVANMFYRADHRDYDVLVLDLTRVSSEVKYDDHDQTFPHVCGPLNTSAVVGLLAAQRAVDGTFVGFAAHA